jgi:hypothetical protein
MPAGQRAAAAIKDNPDLGNRAIAGMIGVDEGTVRKARKSGADHSAPERRIGLDGKPYPVIRKEVL